MRLARALEAAVEVERVPEFKEKTAPGAYYEPAAMDGSRPGMFYANLHDIKATPTYGMRTMTYHEAVPGHHFQLSIQREQEDLPFFRRLIPFPAYAEGWALYAERLAKEMGLLENPYDDIGRLQAELFRAVYDPNPTAELVAERGLAGDVYRAATIRTGRFVR